MTAAATTATTTAMPAILLSRHCVSFGVPFHLCADSDALLEDMMKATPFGTQPFADQSCAASNAQAPEFKLLECAGNTGYRLIVDGEPTAQAEDLQPLLDHLARDLMVHVANHAPDRVFLHAGVVAWQGVALLLPGASFAGKTTLVAELVRAGATYYSDEYAVLDDQGRVHPYPRALQVRLHGTSQQTPVAIEQLNGVVGIGPIPVSHVVFAEYIANAQWSPEPVPAGMAALEMLRHTIPAQRTPARAMATLAKMMETATALRSPRGEAPATARALLLAITPNPAGVLPAQSPRHSSIRMRPGMDLLLNLLRGQNLHASPARSIDEAECTAALALAEEEHLLPYAASRLRAQHTPLPPYIEGQLDDIERDAALAAFFWCSELKGVLRAFHQSNIAAVPLKGPILAERLYGSSTLRASRDLDLLVSCADLPRAERVLSATGFSPGIPDDYHRPWRRQSTTLELHFDVENPLAFDFHIANALRRARPSTFQGEPCWLLAPEDELLFLCLHAVRHRFERLSLILDLQLAFERFATGGDGWEPRPEVAKLDNLLALGLAMVRRLQPGVCVNSRLLKHDEPGPHVEALADRLWQRLLTQSSETLDWGALHSFYLEIEPTGWRRLRRRYRHMQILAGRVIGPDYVFAERFGLHRAWQARLLRPLRLLCNQLRRFIRA